MYGIIFADTIDKDSWKVRNHGNMYVSSTEEIAGYKFNGISPKHANFIEQDFIELYETQAPEGLSVTEFLYTDNGSGTVINGESVRAKLGVNTQFDDTFLLNYSENNLKKKVRREFSFSTAAKHLPGFG